MNTYKQLNQQLAHLLFAKKSKLDCKAVCASFEALNLPSIPYIHVAGTNGKGSFCEKISHTLTLAGYRCGKFTSPHLFSFRERIQIDGVMISPREIELYLPMLLERFPHLTFFEIVTLLAFSYFAEKKVDVAVIEVGLGGRLDATNCITPILSVITSIGLDHQSILGNTLEKIAFEKGGIIKKKVPVVLGPSATQQCLKELAKQKQAALFEVKGDFSSYERENQAIALKAIEILQYRFTIPQKAIESGLRARAPCRLESLTFENRQILLDVSHNPQGMAYLFKTIKNENPSRDIVAFISISQNHHSDELIDLIEKECSKIYLLNLTHPKLICSADLKKYFKEAQCLEAEEIKITVQKACLDSLYLFAGSLYMMQEVKAHLGFQETRDPFLILDGSYNFR